LKFSDLHGIDAALKECAEVKGIKMFLLRNGLLKKVKQYDSKLSMILQVYQVSRKYHFPFARSTRFCKANLDFFGLLPQLTQQQDLSNRELEGGWP
jgi:hypothetical protein